MYFIKVFYHDMSRTQDNLQMTFINRSVVISRAVTILRSNETYLRIGCLTPLRHHGRRRHTTSSMCCVGLGGGGVVLAAPCGDGIASVGSDAPSLHGDDAPVGSGASSLRG